MHRKCSMTSRGSGHGPPRTGKRSGRGAGSGSRSRRSVRLPTTRRCTRCAGAAKQARYATETLAVVDAHWPERVAARAEAVQEMLGEYQDRVVRRAWLEDIAPDRPDLAFLAGELAARSVVRAGRTYASAPAPPWKVARKQRLTRP